MNKPFKDRIHRLYMSWCAVEMRGEIKVPSPSRKIVLKWIQEAWAEITPEMVINSFHCISYIGDENANVDETTNVYIL